MSNKAHVFSKEDLDKIIEEKALLEQENKILKEIIAAVPGSIYWKNKSGVYLGCNRFMVKAAGLKSIDDIVGKSDQQLWPNQATSLRQNDLEVMNNARIIKLEEEVDLPQGKRYFTVQKSPLYDLNGNVMGVIGNSIEITELKKTQAALEVANQAKTEFIANMSHDIRTPLTGVIGLSEVLEQTLQNTEEKEKVHMLHDSGEELLHMLNDILDDIKADHLHEHDLRKESFNLHQCINNLIRLESPAATLKKLTLKTDITNTVPKFICSDRNKIHRILLNLMGNAIKFTQSGHISLKVDCSHNDASKAHLKFSVSDTGIGIPEEAQHQVFNKFFKATSSYKGLYEGHGLGLHIAQAYVELLGGHITLTSNVGIGTTFHFDIVCNLGEPPSNLKQNELQPPSLYRTTSRPIHLLLVEDNMVALKTLEFLLKQKGYTFSSAISGEEAWDLLQNETFDAMITDIGLPGISGTHLSQRLRNQEMVFNKPKLPIIGLTGHAKETALDECIKSGINDVFNKPASIKELHSCIQKLTQDQTNTTHISSTETHFEADLPNTEEGLFQLDAFPLFDEEAALSQIGDRQLLITLIDAYLSDDIQNDFQLMQTKYKQGNWEEVEKLAHKIKGGVTYLGTQKMQYACQYLERYYKAGHRKLLDPLYKQLLRVNDDTNVILKQWLAYMLTLRNSY